MLPSACTLVEVEDEDPASIVARANEIQKKKKRKEGVCSVLFLSCISMLLCAHVFRMLCAYLCVRTWVLNQLFVVPVLSSFLHALASTRYLTRLLHLATRSGWRQL